MSGGGGGTGRRRAVTRCNNIWPYFLALPLPCESPTRFPCSPATTTMHYILGRVIVAAVTCLISFISYSSQIFIIWPWYGREWSVELLYLLVPFKCVTFLAEAPVRTAHGTLQCSSCPCVLELLPMCEDRPRRSATRMGKYEAPLRQRSG